LSIRVQQRYQLLIGAHDNLLSIAVRINKSGPASLMHKYEVRSRKDKCGVDLIADVLRFGRLWYGKPNAISNAMSYAEFISRSQHAVAAFTMMLAT
jgi:hypothetical protein